MAHADWIIDLGPGAGHDGGRVVFEGTPAEPGVETVHPDRRTSRGIRRQPDAEVSRQDEKPGAVATDVDALRRKYAVERDRRLRPDGIAQYVEIAGPFAGFAKDPWCDPDFARAPLSDEVDVAIIGAGFGGLLTGARLRDLGVQSIRLIDKAADVGGTWYWNRYPGIACDVESYVYMPLLEELGYVPTEKYAKGPEIFAHCRHIAEHYDLYRDICLQTEVHEIRWDPELLRWIISTNHDDAIRARFVAMANGYLQKPKLPGIEGIMAFSGAHIPYQSMGLRLHRRRSGEARGQAGRDHRHGRHRNPVCPAPRARRSNSCSSFSARPSTVDVRGNRPTDPAWSASLYDGWQRRRIENFQLLTAGGEDDEDLVDDAWTSIVKKLFVMRQTSRRGDVRRRSFARSGTRRLRQDGGDPCPRRFDRGRPRHRRSAQTLVRLLLQAALLSRRLSADVQPRQRDARRYAGHGC